MPRTCYPQVCGYHRTGGATRHACVCPSQDDLSWFSPSIQWILGDPTQVVRPSSQRLRPLSPLPGLSTTFLKGTAVTQEIRATVVRWGLVKLKGFGTTKETMERRDSSQKGHLLMAR